MSRATARAAVILVALLLGAQAAHAHPVHIQSGVVELTEDRVIVQLAISSHEAKHLGTTVAAIADELQRSLHIFDEFGARLTLDRSEQIASTGSDVATLKLSYAPEGRSQYLTFQQRTPSDSLAHHRQMQLSIVRPDDRKSAARTIRLSSAGNAVTIARRPTAPLAALDGVDPFRDPLLLLTPNDSGTRLELHIPAPLMETWLPIEREQRDVITADELGTMTPKVQRWFLKQFSIADSRDDAVSLRAIRLLRPGETRADPSRCETAQRHTGHRRDVGFWCARIAMVADVQHASEPPAELKMELFNSAVLSLPVVVLDEAGAVQARHTLSTYTPTMTLAPPPAE